MTWRRVLAIMAAVSVFGWGGVFVLSGVLNRIEAVEQGLCTRLQFVRDDSNRNSAIIYLVLTGPASRAPQRGGEFEELGKLPRFRPTTNCAAAVKDPENYRPGDPIPFVELTPKQLDRILGRMPRRAP